MSLGGGVPTCICCPGFYARCLLFVAGTQETALNHQALGAGGFGASTSESHGTVAIRKAVLDRVLPTGHYPDKRLRHSPGLSVKEASCLSWSFRMRGRLQIWHVFIGLWRCSQGT